jgi:nicotinamide mononucleotide adenylyltransferase
MKNKRRTPLGCAHGRFQIVHNDHLAYLIASIEQSEFLLVGVTCYDIRTTCNAHARSHRELLINNPLTFCERFQMITSVLVEAGYSRDRFAVIPFPIETPERLRDFVPKDALCFTTVRERWNKRKIDLLRHAGYQVRVLWTNLEKPLSGTDVRTMIALGDKRWRELVPPSVYALVRGWGITRRLRILQNSRRNHPRIS